MLDQSEFGMICPMPKAKHLQVTALVLAVTLFAVLAVAICVGPSKKSAPASTVPHQVVVRTDPSE